MGNEKVFKKMGTAYKYIITITKRELKLLGNIIRKEGLENLTHTGHFKDKRREKFRVTYLTSLCEWFVKQEQKETVKGQKLLKATKDRKLWSAMIIY